MKNDNARLTLEQQRELHSQVIRCLPTDVSWKTVEDWLKNPKDLASFLSALKNGRGVQATDRIKKLIAIQQERYKQAFGVEFDFSGIEIPEAQSGFDRLIIMQKDFGPNKYCQASEKHFSCWRYVEDLDKEMRGRNEREWDKTYAIWVRSRKEADEELENMSANTLEERRIKTMTLAERLWLGLDWFLEKKEYLDEKNVTLCSGSRFSDGCVPGVNWCNGEMQVDWYYPRDARSGLRARAVVS